MENMTPTPDEASRALADADAARARLAGGQALPSWFSTSIGAAIGVQIATTAAAITSGEPVRWLLALAGLAVFALVAGVQLARYRRRNGVWLAGLVSRFVLGTATPASVSYAVAMAAAAWSALAGRWWLTVCCAVAGGAAYAVCGRYWLRAYRGDPAAHAQAEPAWWLAVVCAAAVGGGATLLAIAR
ncbi:MAG TPA: hypothetical protein VGF84_08100 [Micromonosporaceae bacterium]|jgi:hypothetical protein